MTKTRMVKVIQTLMKGMITMRTANKSKRLTEPHFMENKQKIMRRNSLVALVKTLEKLAKTKKHSQTGIMDWYF